MMVPKFNQRFIFGFNTIIPHQVERFRRNESFVRCVKENIRTYRRFFTLLFSKQLHLELDLIPERVSKILWLNPSSTSIGDSIMELSGRKLLDGRSFKVHLLTDRKNSSLYTEDHVFQQVFTDPRQITESYDLILVDVYNTKSIRMKYKYFPSVPFCALQGYFYGADFNRLLFSFHRINALLNYPYSQNEIDQRSRHYLCLNSSTQKRFHVVVAVGGEDSLRTYLQWNTVVSELLEMYPNIKICLVGSDNGLEHAKNLSTEFNSKIDNKVAKLSILETAQLIVNSNVFLGADGGLMHIAAAFDLAGVALFAKFRPELRLGYTSKILTLFTDANVNQIEPTQIITELTKLKLFLKDESL
ncbi:MAG: hypothetical protein KAZ94_01705 [Burkholderiales bacterium]|nr:hypothetical protein [Burkholderiales bacterium]